MDEPWPPTDAHIAACDVIWDCYKRLGVDDMTDGTYDRNEFYLVLRLLTSLAQWPENPEGLLAACRVLRAATAGGDVVAMQLRFEQIMDETYLHVGEESGAS